MHKDMRHVLFMQFAKSIMNVFFASVKFDLALVCAHTCSWL